MTQEQALFDELYSMAKASYDDGYQASRESLKQKLLSEGMVEIVAAAIDAEEHKNDGDAYPLAKRIKLYGRDSQYEIFNKAKAALQAVVGAL